MACFLHESVELFGHAGVVIEGIAVDWEHSCGITNSDDLLPREPVVNVCGKREDRSNVLNVRLTVEYSLVEVSG